MKLKIKIKKVNSTKYDINNIKYTLPGFDADSSFFVVVEGCADLVLADFFDTGALSAVVRLTKIDLSFICAFLICIKNL